MRKPRPTENSAIASNFGLKTASEKTGSFARSMFPPGRSSRILFRKRSLNSADATSSTTVHPSVANCRQFSSRPNSSMVGLNSSEIVSGASVSCSIWNAGAWAVVSSTFSASDMLSLPIVRQRNHESRKRHHKLPTSLMPRTSSFATRWFHGLMSVHRRST